MDAVQKFLASLKPEDSQPKGKLPYRYTTCRYCGDVVAFCSCLVEDLMGGSTSSPS